VNVFPKIIFGPNPLIFHFPVSQQLDQYPDDLGPVELVTSHSPCVIAQVIKESKVPWGEDELDAVFDRLRFGRSRRVLGCRLRLLHFLSPAKDVIPASGERILA
jgi:hypothetical protein